jgi:hypothetical protein
MLLCILRFYSFYLALLTGISFSDVSWYTLSKLWASVIACDLILLSLKRLLLGVGLNKFKDVSSFLIVFDIWELDLN